MQCISIEEVVSEIFRQSENGGSPFLIGFVRSSGPRKGEIKIVEQARRGVPTGFERSTESSTKSTEPKTTIKDRGTLPLVDLSNNQYITPLISHVVRFNNYKVLH